MQVSTTLSLTLNSAVAVVGSATGLFVGMYVSHPKVPSGTKLNAISGLTVTLSNVALANATPSAALFSPLLDAQTVGATGGAILQSTTLATANLPAYTPIGTVGVTNGAITINGQNQLIVSGSGGGIGGGGAFGVAGSNQLSASQAASSASFVGSAQGGTDARILNSNVQPTIVMNFVIKR